MSSEKHTVDYPGASVLFLKKLLINYVLKYCCHKLHDSCACLHHTYSSTKLWCSFWFPLSVEVACTQSWRSVFFFMVWDSPFANWSFSVSPVLAKSLSSSWINDSWGVCADNPGVAWGKREDRKDLSWRQTVSHRHSCSLHSLKITRNFFFHVSVSSKVLPLFL